MWIRDFSRQSTLVDSLRASTRVYRVYQSTEESTVHRDPPSPPRWMVELATPPESTSLGSLPGPIWQSPIYFYRRARDGGHHRPLRRRQGDQLLAGSRSAPGCAPSGGLYQPTHGDDIAVAKQVGSRLCAMLTATRSAQSAPPQPDRSTNQLAGCLLRGK